jgi:hypothetical protein
MAAAVEFTDAELIEFNRKKNKLLKNIREAEFTKFKELRPNLSNAEIYDEIDRVTKEGAYYGRTLYKNSATYNELWDKLMELGESDIYRADSRLRLFDRDRWSRIQIAANLPEAGGGRTKRSRRSRKQRKTKRRARR